VPVDCWVINTGGSTIGLRVAWVVTVLDWPLLKPGPDQTGPDRKSDGSE